MKKIVIAPDKFKGSLTAMEVCKAIEKGILKHCPEVEIIKCPMADGGDGTVEVIKQYIHGELVEISTYDPLLRPIKASYLSSNNKQIAYIEMAEASGIRLLKSKELNPLKTSTYGTGVLIKDAIEKGAKHIILGIGGSATNDAGLGMASALGYRLYNKTGAQLHGKGADLIELTKIDSTMALPQLKEITFEVACDVDNPLHGNNGAAFVYAQQKGANAQMIQSLDAGLRNFDHIISETYGLSLQEINGSGAAGGLGGGCFAFLGAKLSSGFELINKLSGFTHKIHNADWVITGEGQVDAQTFSGKVINGIINSMDNQKLAIFCGSNDLGEDVKLYPQITCLYETVLLARNQEDSIQSAQKYLEMLAEQFACEYLK